MSTMLNIDPAHHESVQSQAVALAGPIRAAIRAELDAGMRNIFFLGAGGVAFLALPAARMLQTQSTFPTYVDMAAEAVVFDNVNLGEGSLVVFPSVSGTTKEAIAALEFAKRKGARVMTLTGTSGTPLAQLADINFQNDCADPTSSENYYIQTLLIALAIMHERGEFDAYDAVVSELGRLPSALIAAKESFEPRAAEIAAALADEKRHVFTSAGGSWHEAHYFAMCILEEMQWIWTRPVHASDFFHGTLELVEEDTSVVLLKGEDAARPLADRVEAFATKISKKVTVIDSRDFALDGLSDQTRALVSPIVFATVLERLSAHLEKLRDHPLTTRRYYKRMDY